MPRYKPATAKLKAKNLLKPILKNRFNQTATAKELGVCPHTINEQFHSPIVQQTLAEYLNRYFPRTYIRKKFKDGLEAKKVIDYLHNKKADDLYCRHKYLVTLLECQGFIKHNGNEKGVNVSTVIINIRNPDKLLAPHQAELISSQRSKV